MFHLVSWCWLMAALLASAGCGPLEGEVLPGSDRGAGTGEGRVTLSVTRTGDGKGALLSSPAGIDCGSDCVEELARGTPISLSAFAGARFLGWTGGGCTGAGPCTLTVDDAVEVSAAFALETSVVVTRAGSGSGLVSSIPEGIHCGTDCSEAFAPGSVVTLVARQNAGSIFEGWSKGCGGAAECTLTLEGPLMVTASFTLERFPVWVVIAGSGQGTVTTTPATGPFESGSSLTMVPAPSPGSRFAGWTGGGCSGTASCTLVVTEARAVVATFEVVDSPLTITFVRARAPTARGARPRFFLSLDLLDHTGSRTTCTNACNRMVAETCGPCAFECGRQYASCARPCLVLPDLDLPLPAQRGEGRGEGLTSSSAPHPVLRTDLSPLFAGRG